ncbi:ribonuclease HI family protein [Patescibacteria group bacterium]|nr:ribonuclease HI family protein [Patescibacteria group bacterium]
MSSAEKIIINTDGGSRGNPGLAALGVVFFDERGKMLKSYGKTLGTRTNNEAEYEAVIFALQKAKSLYGGAKIKKMEFEIRMDSELIVSQLNGKYKIEEEKLEPLFLKIWNLKIGFGPMKIIHIPREKNREADRMVNEALDKEQGGLF